MKRSLIERQAADVLRAVLERFAPFGLGCAPCSDARRLAPLLFPGQRILVDRWVGGER